MGGESGPGRTLAIGNGYPKYSAKPKGKHLTYAYRDRLRQFTDRGQYYAQGLMSKIVEAKASGEEHVNLAVWSAPGQSRPTFKDATSHAFKDTRVGESFGPSWTTHWFKVRLTVPAHICEREHVEFQWDSHSEAMIWTEDGDVVHGLTGDGERTEWVLPRAFLDGEEHVFYVEMACNGMFGNGRGGSTPPDENRWFELEKADICAINLEARALYYDFWVIGDAAREFPEDGWHMHEALNVCNEIMDVFEAANGSYDSIRKGREIARKYIGNVDTPEIYDNGEEALITAVGHCHIDSCWLWPFAETKRKVARSWSNQCDLLDRYPELRFTCSQAQQYKWLKEGYPSTFDRVKAKIKEGTFQPIGGSWVEHDTNMPSGESLVRQFLYGQRFFESNFGQRCRTFWLPDTFGYTAQLPQLTRLAGMDRFFTQKLSWNSVNSFPHTTFNWVSLDGSQVLCHMTPADTYTAEANFGDVQRCVMNHKSLDQDNTSLLVFGKGDGGGGPTYEHIEKLRRCRGMSDTVGLLPRVRLGDSVEDFFDKLEKKVASGTEFCTWYGELYFELHRATYTTQANNKRNNRAAEALLHDVELLATLASVKDAVKSNRTQSSKKRYRYPKKAIDEMWEKVLRCQFHDCLPGSSIEMCYRESDQFYKEVFETGERVLVDALGSLGFADYRNTPDVFRLFALNTLPWARDEIINVSQSKSDPPMYGLASTTSTGITEILPLSIDSVSPSACRVQQFAPDVFEMANSSLIVNISQGLITSIYDVKADRQIIVDGAKANQLVLFDDKPNNWMAWDVDVFHLDSRKELYPSSSSIVESGPHRAAIVTETKISEMSWVRTTISLTAAMGDKQSMVEMDVEIEWRETYKFLKVEFPVDIVNTDASYETAYGIVRRPTHFNTSWDMAKFEVCCHRFADLSEATYGVSILNDSKYGFATQGKTMRLSLVRASKAPDAHADMGRHRVRYAILPHQGPLSATTIKAARNFNNPMKLVPVSLSAAAVDGTIIEPAHSLLSSFRISGAGSQALVIDTVKRGEDDEDVSRGELPRRSGRSVVLRVYDSLGGRAKGRLEWGNIPVRAAWRCNLLEDDLQPCAIGKGGMNIVVKAFEVVSFRLEIDEAGVAVGANTSAASSEHAR